MVKNINILIYNINNMINAKKELTNIMDRMQSSSNVKILCAQISHRSWRTYEEEVKLFQLKMNHTPKGLEDFLNSLDFEYDDGFGSQELYGTVWFTDGVWLEREEYDGSECWQIKWYPSIPAILQ